MATYVLMHGAASDSWYWHRVAPRLRALGHEVIAPDLPCDDDSAGLEEYADVVVQAVGDRSGIILVAQSMAGLSAPIVATRVPTRRRSPSRTSSYDGSRRTASTWSGPERRVRRAARDDGDC